MIQTIEKSKCTGCKMCADVCPTETITFQTDEQGFWYPRVGNKCINCGLCLKKCPSLNNQENNDIQPGVYALWSKDDNTRITSTSGGVFWEIAKKFISKGGVVVGCKYRDDWKSAEHAIAYNEDELLQLKGSKYFQSDTEGIYKKVKKILDDGKKVLFCGSPCQIAAIKSFVGEDAYNLYCIDFICRSINSPKAFKAYIDELEKKNNSKVIEVHLKNKKYGWQSLASKVKFENGEESIKDKNNDFWVKGFIYNDLYTRESCYYCKYKVLPRINSDISIGDFWKIQYQHKEDMFKGISVMLVNTKKGRELFEDSKESFEYKSHSLEEALIGNPALLKNPVKTDKQKKFFNYLKNNTFSYSVNQCLKESILRKVIKKIKNLFLRIKHILRLLLKTDVDLGKYIYYNYFSKNVIRKTDAKIIIHKNAILDLQTNSKIILSGERDLNIGINKLKGSRAETYIRLNEGATWNCRNGADLFYNTTVEVKQNACFDTGFFSANGGSVIIAHKRIIFGEDVMIGRNVIVYDSDFHSIYNSKGIASNPPKTVTIEDHVWLTSNIIVQKGVTIGKNSLITAYTTVNKEVPEHTIFGGDSLGKEIKNQIDWGRTACPLH